MTWLVSAAVVALVLAGLPAQASTATECERALALIGRAAPSDTDSATGNQAGTGADFLDCTPDQMAAFTRDIQALRSAGPATSASELIGTWVSDDVHAIYQGVFLPVYEVLEISPGAAETEVRIVQTLIRANDPAEPFIRAAPPVDVTAAGRTATYGSHVATLNGPGQLQPRQVRYHDVPLDRDRHVGLAMKARFTSFQQAGPIGVGLAGEELALGLSDRLAPGGQRLMTYRKRRPELPEIALKIALVGNLSMTKFHCLLEAMGRPTPAYEAALGDVPEADFFAALSTIYDLGIELQAVQAKLGSAPAAAEAETLKARAKEIAGQMQDMNRGEVLAVLYGQIKSDAPFGCPNIF